VLEILVQTVWGAIEMKVKFQDSREEQKAEAEALHKINLSVD
jgi:hypothetical protein